jgi:crossover junction endodeoxyribonuclease RusA
MTGRGHPGKSVRDLVQAGIQGIDRIESDREELSGLLDPSPQVVWVAPLESSVGSVKGVAEVVADSAHDDDSRGGATGGKYSQLPEPVALKVKPFIGIIHIPLETDPLSLNKSLHWATEGKLKKQWRRFSGLQAARFPAFAKVDVTLTWFVITNRVRDEDNMARLLKCLCDGLTDAGVVPDDSPQYMGKKCRIERSPERTTAYMELRIEQIA